MLYKNLTLLAVASIALFMKPAAAAEDQKQPWSMEVGAGVEYDSNVAVLELDTASGEGDVAAILDLGVAYDAVWRKKLSWTLGYDFSQSLHEEFGDFDVAIHRGSANLSYDVGRTDIGSNFQYAHAALDGNEFLVLTQLSPFVTRLVGKRLFLRFAYVHSDKSFAAAPQRDAQAHALSTDAYVFLDGLTTYLAFGYRYNDEDALDRQFDYAGSQFKVQLTHRFTLASRALTIKSALRSESRDYDNPTLAIGERRREDRYQFDLNAELPFTRRITGELGYKYADNRSNLPGLDFGEHVVSLGVKAALGGN